MDSDSDSGGDCYVFDDDDWDYRPQRQPAWKKKNAQDLQSARQILESPTSDSGAQTLSHLASTNGYNILRDALEKGFTDVAQEMIKLGVHVNNATGNAVDSPLHFAALKCNKDIVELLLSKGAKINATNKTGETPLFLAVKENNVEIIRLLVTNNADVNAKSNEGVTPLHCTAGSYSCRSNGDKTGEIARLLLSVGANVNAETSSKSTALIEAVRRGYTEVVKALLEFKADVNVCRGWETPLIQSVNTGDPGITQLLLNNGAEVNARSMSDNRTPLHRAVENCSESIVKVLLSMPDIEVDLQTNQGDTALQIAAGTRNESIVKALVERGADTNIKDVKGRSPLHVALLKYRNNTNYVSPTDIKADFYSAFLTSNTDVNSKDVNEKTPLHYAVQNEHVTFISVLLDHGAEINLRDHVGRTPLHYAALIAWRYTAEPLLEHGANTNLQDNDGKTPLHLAVNTTRTKEYDTFLALLEYGAETNLKDNTRKTPLHLAFKNKLASRNKYLEVTDSLLAHGAQVNVKDDDGKTPLHYASERCFDDKSTLSSVLKYGADVNAVDNEGKAALHIASSLFWERSISELLENGADPNIMDVNGRTPLHNAVESGRENNVLVLINHVLQPDPKDNSGKTPLHYAAKIGMVSALSVLLKRGANVNSKDIEGKTPLFVYAETGPQVRSRDINVEDDFGENVIEEGHCAFASILLAHGADVDCMDKSGKTELHLAAGSGRVDVVRALLKYGADINVRAYVFPNHTPVKCSKSSVVSAELEKHIIMLSVLNLPIDEMNLESIDFSSSRVKEFQTQCEIEITRSTEVPLVDGDKTISFYDILIKNQKKISIFLKNGISSDVSKSLSLQNLRNFPIYRNMIVLHFRLAVERVPFMQEITVLLGHLFSIPPGICVEAITDYLRNTDLKSFTTACRSTEK